MPNYGGGVGIAGEPELRMLGAEGEPTAWTVGGAPILPNRSGKKASAARNLINFCPPNIRDDLFLCVCINPSAMGMTVANVGRPSKMWLNGVGAILKKMWDMPSLT